MLGNGNVINFWTDRWCDAPLVEMLQIPDNLLNSLISKVKHFILEGRWTVPQNLQLMFPNLLNIVQKVTIPYREENDTRIWSPVDTDILNLKVAYVHCSPATNNVSWGKLIWNISISPFKSLLFWRLLHNKLPTDENLMLGGMVIPSCCSLCYKKEENTNHLFFDCDYASNIWRWMASSIGLFNNQIFSLQEVLQILNFQRSPQCKILVLSVVINSVNAIWYARNQKRFNYSNIHWRSPIAKIASEASLSGNTTRKSSSSSITDFVTLKAFNVTIHPPNTPSIKEVFWMPPFGDWIKCNSDGAVQGVPGLATCGGIFRNANAEHLGSYLLNIGPANAFQAELIGAMLAIELADKKKWNKLWLEIDSKLVVQAFQNPHMVPWKLRNGWINCLQVTHLMSFMITHIYRESNHCANKLANLGLNVHQFTWLDHIHRDLADDFARNIAGLPCFRICI